MSADNWGYCPKCLRDKGVVGATHERLDVAGITNTLREDWDIGMYGDGEFVVYYACTCRECGFHYEFKTKKQVVMKKGTSK